MYETARLVPPDAEPGDCFGSKVAIWGDTIVAASPWDTIGPGLEQAGSVYVYDGSGLTWLLQQKFTAIDAATGDNFGFSVAIWDDTLVIGAEHDDHSDFENAGAVYVYTRSDGVWWFRQKLTAVDPVTEDHFGHSTAISEDTIFVGTWGANKVYIFSRYENTWYQDQRLTQSWPEGGNFGQSVSIDGDTLVVGANWFSGGGAIPSQGAAYVYRNMDGIWTEEQRLTSSQGTEHGNLGYSVSIFGDEVVLGARLDDPDGGTDAGAAYVFVRDSQGWFEIQTLTGGSAAPGSEIGTTVVIGDSALIVGTPFSDHSGSVNCGCAQLFVPSQNGWDKASVLLSSDHPDDHRLGATATYGRTSVLGAPFALWGCSVPGAAYVYEREP